MFPSPTSRFALAVAADWQLLEVWLEGRAGRLGPTWPTRNTVLPVGDLAAWSSEVGLDRALFPVTAACCPEPSPGSRGPRRLGLPSSHGRTQCEAVHSYRRSSRFLYCWCTLCTL